MKKFKWILLIIVLSIVLIFTWIYPIKRSVSIKYVLELNKHLFGNKVILIASIPQSTGPMWEVEEYYGIDECPKLIDTIGKDPVSCLRLPIYIYTNKFILIGEFDGNNKELFIVDNWEIIGEIKRNYTLLPYLKNGFNIYEIKSVINF